MRRWRRRLALSRGRCPGLPVPTPGPALHRPRACCYPRGLPVPRSADLHLPPLQSLAYAGAPANARLPLHSLRAMPNLFPTPNRVFEPRRQPGTPLRARIKKCTRVLSTMAGRPARVMKTRLAATATTVPFAGSAASRAGVEFAGGKGPRENQKSHQAPNPINGQLTATARLVDRPYFVETPHQFPARPRCPQPARKAVFCEGKAKATSPQSQKRTVRLNSVTRQFSARRQSHFQNSPNTEHPLTRGFSPGERTCLILP